MLNSVEFHENSTTALDYVVKKTYLEFDNTFIAPAVNIM